MSEMIAILNTLSHTLGQIRVSGRDDLDRMLGCLLAIDRLKEMVKQQGDDDVNGRQVNIGTECGNDS